MPQSSVRKAAFKDDSRHKEGSGVIGVLTLSPVLISMQATTQWLPKDDLGTYEEEKMSRGRVLSKSNG